MGIRFGKNAGTRPAGYAKKLAQKIARSGGNDSTGAGHLLAYMSGELGGDQRHLCPEEAEQAARSLEQAAGRLRGADREIAEKIARDGRSAETCGGVIRFCTERRINTGRSSNADKVDADPRSRPLGGPFMPHGITLTVLRLNPHNPDAAAETGDTHRMHARVAALTGHSPADGGRILWAQPRQHILVIQSPAPPDLAALPAGYASSASNTAVHPEQWQRGQRVDFSLVANPVRRPPRPRDEHGRRPPDRRVPIPPAERGPWLAGKLAGVLDVAELGGQDLGTRTGVRNGTRIAHLWHAFTGRATVTDPTALAGLIRHGVGPGKGYGCGLVMIKEAV